MKGEVVCRLLQQQSESNAGVLPTPTPPPARCGPRAEGVWRLQEGGGGDKMQILAMKAQSWILRLPCEKKKWWSSLVILLDARTSRSLASQPV